MDTAIKSTVDKVLVLRFGREADAVCMQLDEIVSTVEFPPAGCWLWLYPTIAWVDALPANVITILNSVFVHANMSLAGQEPGCSV